MIVFMMMLALLGLGVPSSAHGAERRQLNSPITADPSARRSQYARLPMSFERNEGQVDGRVKYLARGAGYTLFLTADEAVLKLESRSQKAEGRRQKGNSESRVSSPESRSSVLRLKLAGAKRDARVSGQEEMAGKANYFIGNDPKQWRQDVPLYGRVKYAGVYDGVDVVYYGNQEELEYDLQIGAGKDVRQIGLKVEGAEKVAVNEAGELVMGVGGGEVRLKRPEAYQEGGGKREEVEVRYAKRGNGEIGFEVGEYDRTKELVIDPVLTYATYLGGTGGDVAYGVAVDSAGDIYIAGTTNSPNFPTLNSASTTSGNGDGFVAKLDPNATTSTKQLVYSTYLGGSTGSDSVNGIAVSGSGVVYLTGSTSSSDFPATTDAFQKTYGGNGDAFVAQLSFATNHLTLNYASYLGGTGTDSGQAVAFDGSGNAYVTGFTQSSDFLPVPLTFTPFEGTLSGPQDAFVTKVDFSGSTILYSTYLGGSQADVGQGIQVDSSGIYVAGYTFSSDFPLKNPYQAAQGAPDAFVCKLKLDGSDSVYSTYLGGSGGDRAFGIAVDSSGSAYVVGASTSTDFPTTLGSYHPILTGASDAFVTKMKADGTSPVYSTFLGGSDVDLANGVAVDSSGNAYVTGQTQSIDFPTVSQVQSLLGGSGGSSCPSGICADAFVTELNASGSSAVYSTYLGGSDSDFGEAIALGPSSIPYIAGYTASGNFPVIAGAYQGVLANLAGNAFVARLAPDNKPGIAIVPSKLNFGGQTLNVRSSVQTVTIINVGTAPLTISTIDTSTTTSTVTTNAFAQSGNCVGTISAGGGSCTMNVTFTPTALGTIDGLITITDNATGSPHTVALSGAGVSSATQVTITPTSLSFGNQTVGTISAAKSVTITNTGTQTLSISKISAVGDYLVTDTCLSLFNNLLNVGDSCSASVSFQPIASGARPGTLSIADNASGSPQTVVLSGTGVAEFTLSSSAPKSTIVVGSTSATFPITAAAPGSFTGSITLVCPASLTCSFSPSTIFAGQSSTLTLSNLSGSTANPLNFNVTGTSGSESTTVTLTVLLADYSLSISPALRTIVSGDSASYTVAVTPSNGFDKAVNLACGALPNAATCTFTPSSVTPGGSSPGSSTLTVATIKHSSTNVPPRLPSGGPPPATFLWIVGLLGTGLMLRLWGQRRRSSLPGGNHGLLVSGLGTATLALALVIGMAACRPNNPSVLPGGTPLGNYVITVTGTLGSNTNVTRNVKFNLSVTGS